MFLQCSQIQSVNRTLCFGGVWCLLVRIRQLACLSDFVVSYQIIITIYNVRFLKNYTVCKNVRELPNANLYEVVQACFASL